MRDELSSLGHKEVTLTEGSGGVFDIYINGIKVFSKEKNSCGGFPTSEDLIRFG